MNCLEKPRLSKLTQETIKSLNGSINKGKKYKYSYNLVFSKLELIVLQATRSFKELITSNKISQVIL